MPKPIKWAGPFYDSTTFLETKHSRAALDVLPGWIRKAVIAGDSERAAGYLHSLFELLNTTDGAQKTDASLALYRLGSRDQRVMDAMFSALEIGTERLVSSPFSQKNEMVTIRQAVLEHFEFFDDHSADTVAKAALTAIISDPAQSHSRGVLVRFLENMGDPQPESLLIEQLGDPDGYAFGWETLQKRSPRNLSETLRDLSERDPDSLSGVVASSMLFEIGGDQLSERKLVDRVRQIMLDGRPNVILEPVLIGLLRGNSVAGLDEAAKILASDNLVPQEIALRALSRSTSSAALELIAKYAQERTQKGFFPSVALQSLKQSEAELGASLYSELKSSLIESGHTERDFVAIESDRKRRPAQ